MANCRNCLYWDAQPHQRESSYQAWILSCRRRAPMIVVQHNYRGSPEGNETSVDTEFPGTRADAWCGEWESWITEVTKVTRG